MTPKRPDMRAYFAARIDWYVNGMFARNTPRLPAGVDHVQGDVTDTEIVVTMRDGTKWTWTGGRWASRKVHGCYPPLQPKVAS